MRKLRSGAGIVLCGVFLASSTSCPLKPHTPVPGESRAFDGIRFQYCPAGTFAMGSPVSETGRFGDEDLHSVTLSEGFWMGTYEVTQGQWVAVMGGNPSTFPNANSPVETVNYQDVQDYLVILNTTTDGPGYRLPTEAEWEYACRAGTTARFYWGDDAAETAIDAYAWFDGNANAETHRVGQKTPNAWGLHDMSGNVFEWCQDWYETHLTGPVTDPTGPASSDYRVARGGAWYYGTTHCRSAYRYAATAEDRLDHFGFRLLRPLE